MALSIQDLANIVAVTHHAATIINNRGIVKNEERKLFNSKIDELHSIFVEGIKNLDTSVLKTATESDSYLTVVKVGDDNYRPTPADLEKWKEVFEQAGVDKDFAVITHPSVCVERVKMGSGFPASTIKIVGFTPKEDEPSSDQLSLNFKNEDSGTTGFIKYGGDVQIMSGFDGYGEDVGNSGNITVYTSGVDNFDQALKEAEEKELKEIEERVTKAKQEVYGKKKKNPSVKRAPKDD